MAKYVIGNNFAQALRQKASPFAENGFELVFSPKATKGENGFYNGRIVASTKFNKSEIYFKYKTDETPSGDVSFILSKDFEKVISSLSALGKDFEMKKDGSTLEVKSGSAAVRVPILEEASMISIVTPKQEDMIPCICGTGAFQIAVRRALSGTVAQNNEASESLTLFPHEKSMDVYGSGGAVIAKGSLEVTPKDDGSWDALNGEALAVKAAELKAILPVLEGEKIRVFVSTKDQQLIIVSGHDIYTFRLLTKGIPMSEKKLTELFGLEAKAASAVAEVAELNKAIAVATVLQKEDLSLLIQGRKGGLNVLNPLDKGCGMKVALMDKAEWVDYEALISAPLLKAALAVCGQKVTILEKENPSGNGGAFLFIKGDGFNIVILSKKPAVKAEKKEKKDDAPAAEKTEE